MFYRYLISDICRIQVDFHMEFREEIRKARTEELKQDSQNMSVGTR
jgi:hypothetical protein